MTQSPSLVSVSITQAPQPIQRNLQLDLGHLAWHGGGPLGPAAFAPVSLDFMEVARVVWEIEKHTPKRISSQRTRQVSVTMSLRQPDLWSGPAVKLLREALRLLGNAEWSFSFTARSNGTKNSLDNLAESCVVGDDGREAVALFSGGLDSTSGLAWLKQHEVDVALASFYGAKAKQVGIRDVLGFDRHFQAMCQWAGSGTRFGGQFQYRSLLFLSLGAAVAASYGSSTLYQFENGPMAMSLPPSPNYRMTRHAHPRLHRIVGELFEQLHGRPLVVRNPFLGMTKREGYRILESLVEPGEKLTRLLALTETCWNLNSRTVVGTITKPIGQACGLCIPCLVRRTAVGAADPVAHRVDFVVPRDHWFADPAARVHVDAYLAWADKVLSDRYAATDFAYEMPRVVAEAMKADIAGPSMENVLDLYRRFASEIVETFSVPGTKA